jgi:hypothetical protein
VTGDLGEIRVVLAGVSEQLGNAFQHAGLARTRIADAVAVLDGLGEQHSEPLVPGELHHAADELERGLGLISGGVAAVADIDARL